MGRDLTPPLLHDGLARTPDEEGMGLGGARFWWACWGDLRPSVFAYHLAIHQRRSKARASSRWHVLSGVAAQPCGVFMAEISENCTTLVRRRAALRRSLPLDVMMRGNGIRSTQTWCIEGFSFRINFQMNLLLESSAHQIRSNPLVFIHL